MNTATGGDINGYCSDQMRFVLLISLVMYSKFVIHLIEIDLLDCIAHNAKLIKSFGLYIYWQFGENGLAGISMDLRVLWDRNNSWAFILTTLNVHVAYMDSEVFFIVSWLVVGGMSNHKSGWKKATHANALSTWAINHKLFMA